jgi:hypothetical protein
MANVTIKFYRIVLLIGNFVLSFPFDEREILGRFFSLQFHIHSIVYSFISKQNTNLVYLI